MEKHKISDYWNMGTAIGLCAAVGIALGALLHNVILWLGIGAGSRCGIRAISAQSKKKKNNKQI